MPAIPHHLGKAALTLLCTATACLGQLPATSLDDINTVLKSCVEQRQIAGAVTLVADKDKVLSLDAFGCEDLAANKPMQKDSLFWIASQSKPITATALMMLVDEGKVNVDDPVEKYLPEFKDLMVLAEQDGTHTLLKKPAHPVKVRELLSHTGGLAFASKVETPTLDALPLRTAVLSYTMVPLQTEPGAKFQYANAGINTVGRIIEVVSHLPYEDFLRTRLFEPLGMKDTTFWPNEEQVSRLAKSYSQNPPGNSPLREITVGQLHYPLGDKTARHPMPAGGLFSTAEDMGKFCQMILNHGTLNGRRYVTEESVQQMTTKQTGPSSKDEYGFGWFVNNNLIGHSGAFSSNMSINPKTGLVTVFMVQHAGFGENINKSRDAFQHAADLQYGNGAR